jgi:hypothetical protein
MPASIRGAARNRSTAGGNGVDRWPEAASARLDVVKRDAPPRRVDHAAKEHLTDVDRTCMYSRSSFASAWARNW